MKLLRVMDSSGDSEIFWSDQDLDTLARAREAFDRIVSLGGRAFNLGPGGEQTPIQTLEQAGEEALIFPRIVGG